MSEYVVRKHWERKRSQVFPQGESLTEQSHAPALEINTLIARHARAGGLPPPGGQYLDCTPFQRDLQDRIQWSEAVLDHYQKQASLAEADNKPPEPPSPATSEPPAA